MPNFLVEVVNYVASASRTQLNPLCRRAFIIAKSFQIPIPLMHPGSRTAMWIKCPSEGLRTKLSTGRWRDPNPRSHAARLEYTHHYTTAPPSENSSSSNLFYSSSFFLLYCFRGEGPAHISLFLTSRRKESFAFFFFFFFLQTWPTFHPIHTLDKNYTKFVSLYDVSLYKIQRLTIHISSERRILYRVAPPKNGTAYFQQLYVDAITGISV